MRIASLVPSATEILFALGLGDDVVAVTHECDWPEEATERPRLTRSVIGDGLSPAEIDAAVREVTGEGRALYELDEPTLARLDVDLIVTQALCAVCAVSYDDVRAVAERLPSGPDVISLDPERLDDVLDDVVRLAEAAEVAERGPALRADLARRIEAVRDAVAGEPRPRVLALEWLDPPFVGGHWVPEMIEAAGGRDALGEAGVKSRTATWEEIRTADADVVLVMPCGLYADESLEQALDHGGELRSLRADRIFAVDAASSFSRPGPRLADGIELLGQLLHPGLIAARDAVRWHRIVDERLTA